MNAGRSIGGQPTVRQHAAFDFIRYGSVWEDADVLCEGLAPVAASGRLLSIASAGDNVLALLTLDPSEVVAADWSSAQLACVELRMAAFRRLSYPEVMRFLGACSPVDAATETEAKERIAVYRSLRPDLDQEASGFWDAHPHLIRRGAIHAGKFEAYFRLFRRFVLPWIHGRRAVAGLRAGRSPAERRDFYERRWDTWRWRAVFKLFFSRAVMGKLGRDPSFFAQVDGAVGPRILERTRYALVELPTGTNPYLTYILTGAFEPTALPLYLRSDHFETIRARLDRVRLVQGSIEEAGADAPFDGMNLSDVFEYMTESESARVYRRLLERTRRGTRLVYWNLLVPRAAPAGLAHHVRALGDLETAGHARDRAWFYRALHVDEVVEPIRGQAA